MNLELVREAVIAWGQETPEIRRAWLYGSRARGDHRPDSDVDIAIEVIPHGEDSLDGWATYICEAEEWRVQLQSRLNPLVLHLNFLGATDETVAPAVRREGILVFVRG